MQDAPTPDPTTLVERYLDALGVQAAPPSAAALAALHRAHVLRFSHDTIWLSRGRQPRLDDVLMAEHLLAGEGGICQHLNFSFAWLLTQLGYDVTRHHALTQSVFDEVPDDDADGGHVVLTVEADGARWYADVGLGNALLEPIPLVEGPVTQDGGFSYALERDDSGEVTVWRFLHDRRLRGVAVVEFPDEPQDQAEVEAAYQRAAFTAASPLLQNLTASRRLPDGVLMLTNDTLVRRGPEGRKVVRLRDAAEWEAVLREDFLLALPAWSEQERDRLWAKASRPA